LPARPRDVATPTWPLLAETATLCLINAERRQAGEVPVSRSGRLDASAGYHSSEMVRHHFLDHQRAGLPTLLERIQASGYFAGAREGLYGENIGVGPGVNGTAEALVDAWMSSPPHRANILLPQWRDIGIGTAMAPPDRAFYRDFPSTVYTTDFGRRYGHRRCVTVRRAGTRRRRRYCRR